MMPWGGRGGGPPQSTRPPPPFLLLWRRLRAAAEGGAAGGGGGVRLRAAPPGPPGGTGAASFWPLTACAHSHELSTEYVRGVSSISVDGMCSGSIKYQYRRNVFGEYEGRIGGWEGRRLRVAVCRWRRRGRPRTSGGGEDCL
jgi:hypothetical protein